MRGNPQRRKLDQSAKGATLHLKEFETSESKKAKRQHDQRTSGELTSGVGLWLQEASPTSQAASGERREQLSVGRGQSRAAHNNPPQGYRSVREDGTGKRANNGGRRGKVCKIEAMTGRRRRTRLRVGAGPAERTGRVCVRVRNRHRWCVLQRRRPDKCDDDGNDAPADPGPVGAAVEERSVRDARTRSAGTDVVSKEEASVYTVSEVAYSNKWRTGDDIYTVQLSFRKKQTGERCRGRAPNGAGDSVERPRDMAEQVGTRFSSAHESGFRCLPSRHDFGVSLPRSKRAENCVGLPAQGTECVTA